MFQRSVFARTLAHELVHAVLDGVEEKDSLLMGVRPYLASKHPQMLQITLPTFYEKEITGPDSETEIAEEAIAFLTGSLAAEEKKVYFLIRPPLVTDMSDITWSNEPLLSGDVELLIRLGLVPQWMSPKSLGYSEDRITERYYEMVDRHSLSK